MLILYICCDFYARTAVSFGIDVILWNKTTSDILYNEKIR
jgi:hypothetical protein